MITRPSGEGLFLFDLKKSFITILIVLISISLVGLVTIQIYWIRNSIVLRDAQFRRNVKIALSEVNGVLERQEKLARMKQHDMGRLILEYDSVRAAKAPQVSSSSVTDSAVYRDQDGEYTIKFSNSATEAELASSEDLDELIAQESQILKTDIQNLYPFKDYQTQEIADLIFDLSTIEFSTNFLSRYGVAHIDSLLKTTLKNVGGVNAAFHFGIFDKDDIPQLVPERSAPVIDDVLAEGYKVSLLPSDYGTPSTYLHIWFPNRDTYLIRTLWPLLASSSLFMLTVILAFAYTIRTILRQKKVSEIKNDFINNMTHELKTPISTISLACEALSDPTMSASAEKVGHFVGMIKDENKRLGVLVENVLKSAVLDRGEMELSHDHVNMHEVIENSIKNIGIQATRKGGEIRQSLMASQPVIKGDTIHLTNVIINLLDNAIKYSQERPLIQVRTKSNDVAIIIEVSDNGIGISKDDQKRIFDKLFRVSTGNIHNIKGFGLGLSYVQTVVQKHYGTVSVRSELGKGSTFTIQIPFDYDL